MSGDLPHATHRLARPATLNRSALIPATGEIRSGTLSGRITLSVSEPP